MIGRIVVVLLCLGLATAPAAVASGDSAEGGEGSCVWTSREGNNIRAGYDVNECRTAGGSWESSPSSF